MKTASLELKVGERASVWCCSLCLADSLHCANLGGVRQGLQTLFQSRVGGLFFPLMAVIDMYVARLCNAVVSLYQPLAHLLWSCTQLRLPSAGCLCAAHYTRHLAVR